MDLRFNESERAFALHARTWLETALSGEFAHVRGRGGPGDEDGATEERREWEKALGRGGWIGLGWPTQYGGRGLDVWHQVIFAEEYARAGGPGRLGHMGEQLVGPTILTFGTDAQKVRFLPRILAGDELWCQGFSEPDAGSDLASLTTRAELIDGEWVITGQKVWTSLAHLADWCFVLARSDLGAPKHKGLSFLLVPMDQEEIELRPIRQMTGDAEFNETWFSEARTPAENVVGGPGNGWAVAMGTLAVERGISTLGQQLAFTNEWEQAVDAARRSGRLSDPLLRDRLVRLAMRLRVMRMHSLRVLSGGSSGADADPFDRAGSIAKLYWAMLHRDLGEAALDALGARGLLAPQGDQLDEEEEVERRLRLLFEFSRSDTIYGGTNEIQKNVMAERVLGLPR